MYNIVAGWRSPVSRKAHNLEIAGSNPAPAIYFAAPKAAFVIKGAKMRTGAKPSTYIIDGLNFVRSYLLKTRYSDEEALISQTALWLDDLSQGALLGSSFRLVLDGGFRDIGQRKMPRVDVIFAEDRTADDIIFEQASYMSQNRLRVCVVTSDGELARSLTERGVKTVSCAQFFKAFY